MFGIVCFWGEDSKRVIILFIFKVLCKESVAYFFEEGLFDGGLLGRFGIFEFVNDFLS